MFRYCKILLLIALLVSLVECTPAKTKSNKVLLVLAERSEAGTLEYMLKNEVSVMVDMLEKAGFDPVLASPTGRPLGLGYQITPDLKLVDVKVEDYVGVMFPSMAADWISPYSPEPVRVAQKAAALKKPIAAQVHGIFTLSIAGVLDGKQFTLENGLNQLGLVPYGIYKGEGIIQDGNIFTSGICPLFALSGKKDGTKELTQKFIDYLKSHP